MRRCRPSMVQKSCKHLILC
uniref:Uncharacterized protein n=1 Tax=Schistosoma mansoni TaxID=6183 RepID=A0A146MGH0_SCHMA